MKPTAFAKQVLTPEQKKVGVIAKDPSTGPFVEEWKKAFVEAAKDLEEVDITVALSTAALAAKDENELVRSRTQLLLCRN